MRLHVLSDLHLEQRGDPPPPPAGDVVVLAGDIATGTRGVEWAREWVAGRPALYVAGNHEFYGHELPGLFNALETAAAASPVRLLENTELHLDGVRFLGCTLWSDFDFDGAENRGLSMRVCQRVVNDFRHINYETAGQPLTPADARGLHLTSRTWLAEKLAEPHGGATVVVTHHAPLIRTRPAAAPLRAIAGAFASDLTDLMDGERVALWIYGHTHMAADVRIDGTRVVSNPRGYAREPVAAFDPGLTIDLEGRAR